MLRFASSPTQDMNVGHLRVALFNYIVSQQRGEDLIVRIEDTDKKNNIEGKEQENVALLDLFSIKYTQTINQSQNFRFHAAMGLQLLHEKKAFTCFCSPEWIEKKRQEANDNKEEYKYDDACANLPAELVIDNENPFTVRLRKPTEDITIKDHLQGDITFKKEDIDSFVILNVDKTPTYNFASGVDDMLNDISLVICTQDQISDTPKQIHVRTSLQYDKQIEYIHIPNILDDEVSVKSLLEDGFLPEAISNYLISIGNKTPKELYTLDEAQEFFSLENISTTPHRFDMETLKWFNNQHLKNLDDKELSRYVGFADEEIGALAKLYLEEVNTTKELKTKIEPIFNKKEIPDEFKTKVEEIVKVIKKAPYFESYDDFQKHIIEGSGFQKEDISEPLRFALTGTQNGPDIALIYKYLKNYIGEIIK